MYLVTFHHRNISYNKQSFNFWYLEYSLMVTPVHQHINITCNGVFLDLLLLYYKM